MLRIEIIHGGTSTVFYYSGELKASTPIDPVEDTSEGIFIPGNSRGWLTLKTNYDKAMPGDTVILKLYFERSGVQTINVVVSP